MKYYRDYGDKYWVYGNEYGACFIIEASTEQGAYQIAIDESIVIDQSDVIEAYGLYLMQACKWNESNSDADWYICSDVDGHGETTSADILLCVDDRLTIGGAFPTSDNANNYALNYIAEHEFDLIEGYQYQSNFTDTGIVNTGHSEWLREATDTEIAELKLNLPDE